MENTYDVQSPEIQSAPPDGYMRMMGNLFAAPGRAFESLTHAPRWVVPFVLCALMAIVFEGVTARYRMADLRETIQQDQSLAPEEVQRRLGNIDAQRTTSISLRQIAFGATLLTVIQAAKLFALAFVVWLALQLYPGRTRYLQILAVVSFVFLVTIPEQVLKMLLILALGSYRVFLGPAALLPQEWIDSPLFHMLDRLDVFSVWMAFLLGIALIKVAGLSRAKSMVTVSYLWILWLLEGALFGNLINIT